MIFGFGTDVLCLNKFKVLYEKFSYSLVNKILTYQEIKGCNDNVSCSYLAKRFCAKESFLKAFRTGISRKLSWKDCCILNRENGSPVVLLSYRTYVIFQETYQDFNRNKVRFHVSISDTDAVVISSFIAEVL